MARSTRKNPIFGITTCSSEKFDKKETNKKLRKSTKIVIMKEKDVFPIIREISNIWNMGKDGKCYWSNATKADLRK